jgi:hypothetical protein
MVLPDISQEVSVSKERSVEPFQAESHLHANHATNMHGDDDLLSPPFALTPNDSSCLSS